MKDEIQNITDEMIEYYRGDPKRIFHFLKVHSLAKQIARDEDVAEPMLFMIEIAALMHDIGIKNCEAKYHSTAGNYQQIEGPPLAEQMMQKFEFSDDVRERVCYLIAHHHTYHDIDGIDYQILIEADFLVNIFEDEMNASQIKAIAKHFRTNAGKRILKTVYPN